MKSGLLLLCLMLCNLLGFSQSNYYLHSPDVVLPKQINTINILHVDFDTTIHVGSKVERGQGIARADAQPLVRSVKFGMKIIASEDEYVAGRYAAGAAVLKDAADHEPDNPFITYQLARCLYKTAETKPQAYTLYQRLIRQLDEAVPANDSSLNVDVWFVEAYWKLGTLYMDNSQWPEAILSISRFRAAADKQQIAPVLHEEILSYLTECFYNIGDRKFCQHFGSETLRSFPKNQYVRPYLAELRRTATTTRSKPVVKGKATSTKR